MIISLAVVSAAVVFDRTISALKDTLIHARKGSVKVNLMSGLQIDIDNEKRKEE